MFGISLPKEPVVEYKNFFFFFSGKTLPSNSGWNFVGAEQQQHNNRHGSSTMGHNTLNR